MDNTPPRNRLIAFYTALAVVILIALKPVFDTYFDRMYSRTRIERVEEAFVHLEVVEGASDVQRSSLLRSLDVVTPEVRRCADAHLAALPGAALSLTAQLRSTQGVTNVELSDASAAALRAAASAANPAFRAELEQRVSAHEALGSCVVAALQGLDAAAVPAQPVGVRIAIAPTQADAAKLEWSEAFSSGPMPIREAMARIARQGRMAVAAIRPQAQTPMNLDPLRGWQLMPREVDAPVQAQVAPEDAVDAADTDATADSETTPDGEQTAE